MSTIAELVSQLRNEKMDDVVKELQSSAHGIWQEIWNAGHANATARAKDDLKSREDELKAAQEAKTKAEVQLEELRKSQPDVAKVREQYDAEIAELKATHKSELDDKDVARAKSETGRAGSDLRSELVRRGVDPDYADVLASKDSVTSRIRFVDGEVQILQAGKEIPIHPAEEQTAIGVLGDELLGSVPAKFRNSSADSGSGHQPAGGASRSGGNAFDKIREDAKARREAAKPVDRKSAAEKLSMTSQ